MSDKAKTHADKHRIRRFLTLPNLAFTITAISVFVIVAYTIQSNVGTVIAAVTASTAGTIVWWASTSSESRDEMTKVLVNLPMLGEIPGHGSTVASTLTDTEAAESYRDVVNELQSQTAGRVLLISSAEPGRGATTVALNLAISATRSGRRVVLIDGDIGHRGLSRFMSTGASPGIRDIATGDSSLSDAARMWSIDGASMLPVIPSGAPIEDAAILAGINVSDAIESMAERADFVLIDAPPALSSEATTHLAAHADGTILVVTQDVDPVVVAQTASRLSEIGAPILGYVTIRSDNMPVSLAPLWRRFAARVAVGAVLLLGGFGLFTGAQLLDSWNSVAREEFALDEAVAILAGGSPTTTGTDDTTTVPDAVATDTSSAPAPPPPTEEPFTTILLIGSDEDSGASDVILYLVLPTNGAEPFMISFPRDLYVDNPCTGGKSRINALSHGCSDKGINGGTLLSVQISEMTGIDVDHFAEFTFDGFRNIIDAVGGVEICVGEYAVRDSPDANLLLPAGCTITTGTQALSWVRSRHTQILKDGSWRSMPGTSDLMRNANQQDVMFALAAKLKDFESPQQLAHTVASVADAFTLSDTLSLTDAIGLAWSLRGIDVESINRVVIPVKLSRSPSNQSILVATSTVKEAIAAIYGDTLPSEDR